MQYRLEDALKYEQPSKYIVQSEEYSTDISLVPVLTAGKTFILGYTEENQGICKASSAPVILFDDFTADSRYIDFDFKVKSSAVKILHKMNTEDNLKYFYYAMQAIKYKPFSHKRVWISEYSKFTVKQRTPNEQNTIVAMLDKLENAIKNAKQRLIELDELVKSRFIEMFGDLLYDNKSQVSLKNCTKFIDYRGKTPEKCSMGIRLITAKNVRMHNLNFEPAEFIPEENFDKIMTRGFPKSGDILFTTEAPLGYVCVIPEMKEKFCVGQRLITIVPDERINSIYLEYFMSSEYFQDKIWRNSSGSTVKGIKSRFLEKLFVSIAEKSKQNTFAEFVKQVDKSKFVNPLSQEFFMRNFYVFIIYHCITKGCINFCMPK